jgi:hypothetical protein
VSRQPSAIGRTAFWTPRIVDESEADGHDWERGLLLLIAAVLTFGLIDANDRAVEAEEARSAAERELREDRAARSLPNPAIVLDAHTARQFGLRLADIAGGLDAERAALNPPFKPPATKKEKAP